MSGSLESKTDSKVLGYPVVDSDMLRTFTAIAETGSMTKAAKMVFRTPAAVSMQVKKLEELLQCELLIRKSRAVELTLKGETLLRYSRQMLKLNDELVSQFLAPKLNGKVTVGLPEHFGTNELPHILSRFAKAHPSVEVDVIMANSIDLKGKFENGEVELALVSANSHAKAEQNHTTIRIERLVWAVLENSQILKQPQIPLALAEHGCWWRRLALQALDTAGVDYRIAYTSANSSGQLAAVRADLAVAAIPESLVSPPLVKIDSNDVLPEIGLAETALLISNDADEVALTLKAFIEKVMGSSRTVTPPSSSLHNLKTEPLI